MTGVWKFLRQQNLWLSGFSLLVAVVIWVYVTQRVQGPAEVGWHVAVPLEIRHAAEGLTVSGLPETIDVALQAVPGEEQAVRAEVRAFVDLRGLGPGRHEAAVVVPAPPVGRVVGVVPRRVTVDLSSVEARRVPVSVVSVGEPREGFVAEQPVVTPSEVNLRGPSDLVRRVHRVAIEADLTGAETDLEFSARVRVEDAAGDPVSVGVSPGEVLVRIPVAPVAAPGIQ